MNNDPVKAKIIELVPNIMGYWSGCDVCGTMCSGMCDDDEGPTARPITLVDVLRAIPLNDEYFFVVSNTGALLKVDSETGELFDNGEGIQWNLLHNYDNQEQLVKDFIGNCIGV